MTAKISRELRGNCQRNPQSAAWLARVPEVARELCDRWMLTEDGRGDGLEGSCSWLSSMTRADGTPVILKLAMPHMEGEHEVDGLMLWNGEPTVRLLEADRTLGAMLLERCEPGTVLRSVPEPEQDVVLGELLRRLWRAPRSGHPFRPLAAMLQAWAAESEAQVDDWPDAGIVRLGLDLFEQLPQTAVGEVLLATDVHAGNVLRAQRHPWIVIDPKPFVGDPVYDVTQHLLNCRERLAADPDGTIRRFSELAGVDHVRARLWTFARVAAEPRDNWRNDPRWALARILAP